MTGRGGGPAAAAGRPWPVPWYPLAIPIAFILMVWSGTGFEPIWFVRPMLVGVAVTFAITVALALALGDRDRAGLVATAIVVGLVSDDARIAAAAVAVGGLLVAEGMVHRGRPWQHGPTATRAMSALGAVLIVVVLVSTVQQGTIAWAIEDIQLRLSVERRAEVFDPTAPDIFVILLDGFPGDDAARLEPAYDADAFPAALTDRGFDVQRRSRSNYLVTPLALAAIFGDAHIAEAPELRPPYGTGAANVRRLRRFTDQGRIWDTLRAAGYDTTTITSAALELGLHLADRAIEPPGANEFETVLLKHTVVGHAVDRLIPEFIGSQARANVLGVMQAASTIAAEPHDRPRFVFAHVMAPHPPLLFAADGTPTSGSVLADVFVDPEEPRRSPERVRATFAYAEFTAGKALGVVDDILAGARRDPVIVVFSDHGSGTLFVSRDPFSGDLNERTSNILAIRTPGHPHLLPPGTTPINVLPRILNAYLGTDLPLRSDTTWAWQAGHSILDAVPVDTQRFAPGE